MYVNTKNAQPLLNEAERKYISSGMNLFIDSRALDGYTEVLRTIARESKYNQGETIKPSDLANIELAVKEVINVTRYNLRQNAKNISEKSRTNIDTFRSFLALDDYLYAIAMQELGCPDIPTSFGEKHQQWLKDKTSLEEFEVKKDDYEITTVDNHYTEQRRKSANKVRANNTEYMSFINNKMAPPIYVAKLLAEYQALVKRQEGHGEVWKFFHRRENNAREKLLQDMKNVLVSAVGNDVNLETANPLEMAKKYNNIRQPLITEAAFKNDSFESRLRLPKGVAKYKSTIDQRALNDPDKDDPFKNILTEDEFRKIISFPKDWFKEPVSNVPNQDDGKIEQNDVMKKIIEEEKEVDLENSQISLNISFIK